MCITSAFVGKTFSDDGSNDNITQIVRNTGCNTLSTSNKIDSIDADFITNVENNLRSTVK